jgi:hypothetical protein
MDRKTFLKGTAALGALTGISLLSIQGEDLPLRVCQCSSPSFMDNPACDEELGFARTWVKRLLLNLDNGWDEESRKKLLQSCGKSCHKGYLESNGNPVSPGLSLERFAELLSKPDGVTYAEVKGPNRAILSYVKRVNGQNQPLEKCLCPMVASGPEGLSATYCQCSAGYAKHLFEWGLGQTVKQINLLESLKTGGKICRFEIIV